MLQDPKAADLHEMVVLGLSTAVISGNAEAARSLVRNSAGKLPKERVMVHVPQNNMTTEMLISVGSYKARRPMD